MKICTTYILLIILPVISHGQTQIGFKAGYIYYWFANPDNEHFIANYDYSHNAYSVAVMVRQKIPKSIINLGFEIEYTNRSFSVKSSWGGLGGGQNANFSYSIGNLYLHIQPQFTFGRNVKFYFYPGIYFGTLLNSKLTGSLSYWQMGNPPNNGTKLLDGSAKDYYPNFEFGLYPGIGLEFPLYKNLNILFDYSFTMTYLSFGSSDGSDQSYFLPIGSSWGSDKVKMLNMNLEIGVVYYISKTQKVQK